MTTHWETKISYADKDNIIIRGYSLVDLIGERSFAEVLHLLITGDLPDPAVAKLINAIMVSAIDHGASTPSVLATRTAISGGAGVKNGALAGLLTLDRFHGAAVEDCMRLLQDLHKRLQDFSKDQREVELKAYLANEKENGRRIPGFGHRQHQHDPRQDILFRLAREANLPGEYIRLTEQISTHLSNNAGKPIPTNVDGAIAAILSELNYPLILGNAPFLIARMSSLLVHAAEELETQPRMRRIDPIDIGYTGRPYHRKSDKIENEISE